MPRQPLGTLFNHYFRPGYAVADSRVATSSTTDTDQTSRPINRSTPDQIKCFIPKLLRGFPDVSSGEAWQGLGKSDGKKVVVTGKTGFASIGRGGERLEILPRQRHRAG